MNNSEWSGGKGSKPRKVNKKAYDAAYDNIFKKDISIEDKPLEDISIEDKPIVEDKLPAEIHTDLNAAQGIIFITLTCTIYWILFWFMLWLFNYKVK